MLIKTWSLGQRCQARGYDAIDQVTMLFFLPGAAMLANSWRLEQRHYVLLDTLTDDVMLLRLKIQREAPIKNHFVKYIRQ
jgi:hypothetical protein